MLCGEPPRLHTYFAYRSSKILKTHEIGFDPKEVTNYLKQKGYTDVRISYPVNIDHPTDIVKKVVPFCFGDGAVRAISFWITAKK
jgi:hypothetical protein